MKEQKKGKKMSEKKSDLVSRSPENPPPWSDPTPEMMETPEFNALYELMKRWDINVPEVDGEGLYCGANDNHVRAILDALCKVAIVMKREDAESILYALRRVDSFFRSRDRMESHIHLDPPMSSPITKMVTLAHRRMEAYLVVLDCSEEKSGTEKVTNMLDHLRKTGSLVPMKPEAEEIPGQSDES